MLFTQSGQTAALLMGLMGTNSLPCFFLAEPHCVVVLRPPLSCTSLCTATPKPPAAPCFISCVSGLGLLHTILLTVISCPELTTPWWCAIRVFVFGFTDFLLILNQVNDAALKSEVQIKFMLRRNSFVKLENWFRFFCWVNLCLPVRVSSKRAASYMRCYLFLFFRVAVVMCQDLARHIGVMH